MTAVRIGTRGSRLATTQAHIATRAIEASIGPARVVSIATRGDAISARRPHGTWAGPDGDLQAEVLSIKEP